jgi:hypothetical protein
MPRLRAMFDENESPKGDFGGGGPWVPARRPKSSLPS